MKNKVLKQMLAFSLAVALVGGNSVATFAAEPTNGTESSTNTQATTDATGASATFRVDTEKGYFDGYPETMSETTQENLQERDYAIGYFPAVVAREGYVWTGWKITDQDGNSTNVGTEYAGAKTWMFTPKAGNVKVDATFKKNVTKKTATLYVAYVDENAHQVGTTQQKITKEGNDGENYTFNITNLNVPDGYELVTATWEKSVAYGDEEFVNVTVKKKEAKKADAVLRVHYVDENGTPLDGSQYIVSLTKNGTVGEKATFAATSFKAPEGYELVGGDITDVEVAYGKDKDVNVKVKAIKEEKEARDVIVNFNVAPEEGQFKDPAGAKVVTYTIKEDSADQFLVPKVEAKEGYEFTGWLVNGKEEGFWSADAKTFGITGLAHFPEGDDKGYIVVTAQFKKAEVAKRSVTINVAIDPEKGEFVGRDDKYATITHTDLDEFAEAPILLPEVKANDGYRLAGWTVEGRESIKLDANATTLGFAGLAHFNDGENVGYISVEPVFEEVKEEKAAVVNANVVVDPEKGEFEGYDGATKLENNNLQEADYTLGFLPTVTAKEGYTWTGWEVTNKADEVVYSLDTNTSSIAFPYGVEDDYTVTATFTENKTTAVVNANVVVDPEKGEFEGYDGATKLENNNLQEADYTLGFLPTVTAKEGYTWTGWEVTNKADEVVYSLDTNTSSIAFPYGVEDDYTVTATFTKDETPVDPVDPVEPTEPTQPAQPATPSTDNTVNNTTNKTTDNKKVEKTAAKKAEAKNENKKAPKTGDESMPIAYMLTLVGAAVAAIIVLIKRKRTI